MAVKEVRLDDDGMRADFQAEVRTVQALNHPNIVGCFGAAMVSQPVPTPSSLDLNKLSPCVYGARNLSVSLSCTWGACMCFVHAAVGSCHRRRKAN